MENFDLPRFSFIIAARNAESCQIALRSALQQVYPADRVEILVATGRNPSEQRNQAAEIARAPWLYFLDDDTRLDPKALRTAADFIGQQEGVHTFGGPLELDQNSTALQRVFHRTYQNPFFTGPFFRRHEAQGQTQTCGEEALTLGNMVIRRDWFEKSGGFDPRLYPGEECDLLQRGSPGRSSFYLPRLEGRKLPRPSLLAFGVQFLRYGMGRMRTLLISGRLKQNFFYLLPLLVLLGLFLVPKVIIPLLLIQMVGGSLFHLVKFRQIPWLEPFCALLLFFSYALGLLFEVCRSLFWGLKADPSPKIDLHIIKSLSENHLRQ